MSVRVNTVCVCVCVSYVLSIRDCLDVERGNIVMVLMYTRNHCICKLVNYSVISSFYKQVIALVVIYKW